VLAAYVIPIVFLGAIKLPPFFAEMIDVVVAIPMIITELVRNGLQQSLFHLTNAVYASEDALVALLPVSIAPYYPHPLTLILVTGILILIMAISAATSMVVFASMLLVPVATLFYGFSVTLVIFAELSRPIDTLRTGKTFYERYNEALALRLEKCNKSLNQ